METISLRSVNKETRTYIKKQAVKLYNKGKKLGEIVDALNISYDAAIAQFKGFAAYVNMENAGVITAHGDENKSDKKLNEIREFAKKL